MCCGTEGKVTVNIYKTGEVRVYKWKVIVNREGRDNITYITCYINNIIIVMA